MKLDQLAGVEFSEPQRQEMTRAVMRYLDSWRLSSEQIINLLDLPESVRSRHLAHFRSGLKAFPDDQNIWNCVDHIIGISEALRTTYPFSDEMRLAWLRKPHRRFKQQTPLQVMLNEGADGLLKVRIDIDCAFGWKISESLAAQQKS